MSELALAAFAAETGDHVVSDLVRFTPSLLLTRYFRIDQDTSTVWKQKCLQAELSDNVLENRGTRQHWLPGNLEFVCHLANRTVVSGRVKRLA